MKPDRARVLSEGLITGLIGSLVIILFYGVFNLLAGEPFFSTAALLGSDLASTTRQGGALGAALAFNGLHVVVFVAIGLVAAWLVMETEKHPSFFVVALFIGIAGMFLVLAAFLAFAASSQAELPIGSVVVANLLAGAGMGGYLLKAHPRLWSEIRDHLDPEEEHPAPGRQGVRR